MAVIRWGLVVVVGLLVLYGIFFLYLAPLLAGQGFADAFRRLDVPGMAATLCDETTTDQILRGAGDVGGEIIGALTGLLGEAVPQTVRETFAASLQTEGRYDMLSSVYTFRLRLAGDVNLIGFDLGAGVSSPEVSVNIRRGPLAACVSAVAQG